MYSNWAYLDTEKYVADSNVHKRNFHELFLKSYKKAQII